jgi:hypothetical protein
VEVVLVVVVVVVGVVVGAVLVVVLVVVVVVVVVGPGIVVVVVPPGIVVVVVPPGIVVVVVVVDGPARAALDTRVSIARIQSPRMARIFISTPGWFSGALAPTDSPA